MKKSLVDAMTKGAIEESNYWGAELVCCGCFLELWEVLFEFMSRNVGMSNPKMPVIVANALLTSSRLLRGSSPQTSWGCVTPPKCEKYLLR